MSRYVIRSSVVGTLAIYTGSVSADVFAAAMKFATREHEETGHPVVIWRCS